MDNNKKDCPCEAVEHLICLVNQHDEKLEDHEERLDNHDERLHKGDTDFAVIKDKLNLIIGILGTIGAAVVVAIIGQIM